MSKTAFSLLLLAGVLVSAGNASAESSRDRYRHGGRNGIILFWNGSWDLGVGSVESGIGYKRWFSDKLAAKTFVSVSKTDTTFHFEDYYPIQEVRIRKTQFSALVGAEVHFWSRERLSFFAGGAIQFRLLRSTRDEYGGSRFTILGLKEETTTYGIQGSLGVEYFLFRSVSLQVGYQVDSSMTDIRGRGTWSLSTSTSSLIVTLYP